MAKAILDNHSDKVDVYFICNEEWNTKLSKIDDRFKLCKVNYVSNEAKNRSSEMINKFKEFLKLPHMQKVIGIWNMLVNDRVIIEIDKLSAEEIRKIDPDFLL